VLKQRLRSRWQAHRYRELRTASLAEVVSQVRRAQMSKEELAEEARKEKLRLHFDSLFKAEEARAVR